MLGMKNKKVEKQEQLKNSAQVAAERLRTCNSVELPKLNSELVSRLADPPLGSAVCKYDDDFDFVCNMIEEFDPNTIDVSDLMPLIVKSTRDSSDALILPYKEANNKSIQNTIISDEEDETIEESEEESESSDFEML